MNVALLILPFGQHLPCLHRLHVVIIRRLDRVAGVPLVVDDIPNIMLIQDLHWPRRTWWRASQLA